MASAVVYEGDVQRTQPLTGGLFTGQKLWFSRSVPSRSRFVDEALQNGAQVVQLEQQADIKLVDHAKKNQAPGTFSYRYVELSVRRGQLEDLEKHRVGSAFRVDRPVGSVITASNGGRNRFTEQEDQLLWNWVKPYMDAGGAWKGNEIYKQLEIENPNHTFQSWRDRWIKHTQFQHRRITESVSIPSEAANDAVEEVPRTPKRRRIEDRNEPQRANIGIVHTRHANTPRYVHAIPAVPKMGNQSSLPVTSGDGTREVTGAEIEHQETRDQTKVNKSQAESPANVLTAENHDDAPIAVTVAADEVESSVDADDNRLPLVYNFTQNEARMLYKATCHILDARPDKLDESWAGVAKEHGHSKEVWRKFFYEIIVPEYKKRNNIESDDELELHVRARLREEREARAREISMAPETQSEATQLHGKDPNIRNVGSNHEAKSSLLTDSVQNEDHQPTVSEHLEEQSQRTSVELAPNLQDLALTSTIDHRPPKPNESRKLSQSKGSQSISSQSKSLSTSQPSQLSQPPAPTPDKRDTSAAQVSSEHAPAHDEPSRFRSTGRKLSDEDLQLRSPKRSRLDPAPRQLENSQTTQATQDQEGDLTRFVTQISHRERTISTESPTELEDIPFREPGLNEPTRQYESPSFVLEESEHHEQDPEEHSGKENQSEPQSSPPAVQLLDEANSIEPRMSEYAPSETPSEGILFETQIQLSQPWETAPDTDIKHGVQDDAGEEINVIRPDLEQESLSHTQNEATVADNTEDLSPRIDLVSSSNPLSYFDSSGPRREESTDSGFETAVTRQRTETPFYDDQDEVDEPHSKVVPPPRNNLDTQALFQRPTQIDFNELTMIPEPPDGWDGEELDQSKDQDEKANSTEAADWTLPLPDPSIDAEETTRPSPKDSDLDVDTWLAAQPVQFPNIAILLLRPLSHRALHATNMNLDLASTVLSRMIQRYEKGKRPAHQSLDDIKKLPKRERKTAISDIVEGLLPVDMRGCWTREDDQALTGTDARQLAAAMQKHGEDDTGVRFEVLGVWYAE